MFSNYNYPAPPNPGFPGFQFPPPLQMNLSQNFMNPPPFPINNFPNVQVHLKVTSEDRKKDQKFLENFVNEQNDNTSGQFIEPKKSISKISDVKTALSIIFKLNQTIKSIRAELRHKSWSDCEWQEKMETAEVLNSQITILLKQFENNEFMKSMKNNLEKRKKKRLREKRKRGVWKEQNKEKSARLHLEVDNWIKKKQDLIEREKQEDRLRKDADIVLADVRGKRSDAKKFLALLREMENLRKIKVKVARARGENLSLAADEAFNNIIMKLVEQWSALDREYSLEEQGLNLMIKTDNEKKEEKEKIHAFYNWEEVLFGQRIHRDAFLRKSLLNFVAIRSMWDKFCHIQGTSIPIGWVVPGPPSSAAWQTLLKKAST